MSQVNKKQSEIHHVFEIGNKFLRLRERVGSKPVVDLNEFGNDIRAVRVDEISELIQLLQAAQEHLSPQPLTAQDLLAKYDADNSNTPGFNKDDEWIAGEEIVRAWLVPGRSPEYHEQIKFEFKDRWPTMFAAIEKFVQVRR